MKHTTTQQYRHTNTNATPTIMAQVAVIIQQLANADYDCGGGNEGTLGSLDRIC